MFARLRACPSAVTFDVGAAGLRAAQCRRLRDRAANYAGQTLQFDRGPVAEAQAPAVQPAQLTRLLEQGGFNGRSVALVLSPPEVSFFPLRLPDQALAQPPARLEQALKWEVARESREAAETLEVRYWHLPRAQALHANVMAVALATETARRWCAAFEQEGLDLRRIEVSPCALARVGRELWAPGDNDLWGVLDLGLRHATLTLVIGEVPTYIRTLSVAPQQWTRLLAEAFEVPVPVAEQIKRQQGLRPSWDENAHADNPSSEADLPDLCTRVLRESLRTLAHEVGRCFSYLMQSFPDHAIKGLWLAGGGARLAGLPQLLEAELGIPVHRLARRDQDSATTAPDPAGPADTPGNPTPTPRQQEYFEPHMAAAIGAAILDLEAP